MLGKIFILVLIALTGAVFAELQCSVPGQCVNSEQISSGVENNKNACQDKCKNDQDCNWMTFDTATNFCVLYNTCQNITEANCNSCITSEKDCDAYQCNIQGACQVRLYCSDNVNAIESRSSIRELRTILRMPTPSQSVWVFALLIQTASGTLSTVKPMSASFLKLALPLTRTVPPV